MKNKIFISPDLLAKAESLGILSKDTSSKVRKYAEGGMVAEQPVQPDIFQQAVQMAQEKTAAENMQAAMNEQKAIQEEALAQKAALEQRIAEEAKKIPAEGLRAKYGSQLESLQKKLESVSPNGKAAGAGSSFQLASINSDSTVSEDIPQMNTTQLDQLQQAKSAPQAAGANGVMGAYDQVQKAVLAQGEIGAAQARVEAGYLNQMAEEQIKAQAKAAERAAHFDSLMAEKTSKLEEMVSKTNQMSVDPNRIFANASTGQKVGMLVSVLLGGLNSSGQNQALGALYKVMENDLNAQKENIALAKDGINQQRGILADYRKNFETTQEAESAARIAGLEILKTKIAASAAASNDPMFKARAAEASARIEADQQKLRAEFAKAGAVQSQIQDQKLARIQQLPDNLRSTAMKELQDYQIHSKKLMAFENAAQDIISGKGDKDTSVQNMASLLKGVVSEKELPKYLPSWTDSKKAKQEKLGKLRELVNSQQSFPVLQGAGIVSAPRNPSGTVRYK